MKVIYFDPLFGASGDMIIAALIDLGVDVGHLERQIRRLGFSRFQIEVSQVKRQTISAKHVEFRARSRLSVDRFIPAVARSALSPFVKENSIKILRSITSAESRVHRRKHPHLHELADLDTLIDTVGALLGLEYLGVTEIYTNTLKAGRGFVETAHGRMPAFNFATAYLLRGMAVEFLPIEFELTTPTGAAILAAVARPSRQLTLDRITKVGHGAGTLEVPGYANVLRVFLGEMRIGLHDAVTVLETNLDDQNPQVYDYLFDRLLEAGALDVYLVPTIQKKSRPGTMLGVVAREASVERLLDVIFSETTTLGVRLGRVERRVLPRRIREFRSRLGVVRCKIISLGGRERISLEYEDLKRIAKRRGMPLARVNETVLHELKHGLKNKQ